MRPKLLRASLPLVLLFVTHVRCINRKAHPDAARPSIPQTRALHGDRERKRPTLRSVEAYACTNCLGSGSNQTARTLRVLYLESPFTVVNHAAKLAAENAGTNYPCGACCSDPNLAVPECFVAANWNGGWVAGVVDEVLSELGAQVQALTSANYSAATLEPSGGSAYERCIWEVYYGTVDLCVGSFWETHSRRSMILFTSPIDINTFHLVTMAHLGQKFDIFSIFAPFSLEVWGMMLGMFALTALFMWIVQSEEAETDFADNEVFPQPRGLIKGIWIAMMGYLSGPDPRFVTTSWPGRLITFGFGFFLYITVSSYTANLASFMVLRKQATSSITSIKDIVDGGHKICTNMDMDGMISQPGLTSERRLTSNHFGAILERLIIGDCQAAIVGKYEWSTYVMGSNANYVFCNDTTDGNAYQGYFCFNPDSNLAYVDLAECACTDDAFDVQSCPAASKDCSDVFKFCNVIKLDDPTFEASLNVALPSSSFIEPYVSAWLVKLKQSGAVAEILHRELWAQNPDRCPANTAGGSSGELVSDAQELDLTSMAGTYIISSFFMILGLAMHLASLFCSSRSKVTAEAGEEMHAVAESDEKGGGEEKIAVPERRVEVPMMRERSRATMGKQMSFRGEGKARDLGKHMDIMHADLKELREEVRSLAEAIKLSQATTVRSEAVVSFS